MDLRIPCPNSPEPPPRWATFTRNPETMRWRAPFRSRNTTGKSACGHSRWRRSGLAVTRRFRNPPVPAAGLAFRYLPGRGAYLAGALILVAGSATPYVFFTHRRVFSFTTSAGAAWFGTLTAASYYYFVVRRSLLRSEAERTRYQQAM